MKLLVIHFYSVRLLRLHLIDGFEILVMKKKKNCRHDFVTQRCSRNWAAQVCPVVQSKLHACNALEDVRK